jgi:hypothetical protein
VSGVKLEYCEGEIYARAGGTPAHADLAASITRLLGNALLGRCRVSSADLKVRAVLFVSHQRPQVTVIERVQDKWRQREVRSGEEVVLQSPRLGFSVDELYAGISLDQG